MRRLLSAAIVLCVLGTGPLFAQDPLAGAKKIVVLGDSNSYAGGYIDFFESHLHRKDPKRKLEILNIGLPSETVSGLSEEGHAGGKFPRPGVHERLDRALDKTKPDVILVNYGMNDGIYLPLSDERFQAFKDGMVRLREKAAKAGAKVIHLTPPVFDPVPIAKRVTSADKADANRYYEGYDDVLTRYSEWLLEQRKNGWIVIDIHGPMKAAIVEKRAGNPKFTFSGDGVHPNAEGHQVMGAALCKGLGIDTTGDISKLQPLIRQRSTLLRDAWLNDIGHKRPGMAKGLPVDEARKRAADIAAKIEEVK